MIFKLMILFTNYLSDCTHEYIYLYLYIYIRIDY